MSIRTQLREMAKMPVSHNPYGDGIPTHLLSTTLMLKTHLKNNKPFGEYLQNGYLAQKIKNDYDKTAPWEVDNYVIFSEIRERLYKEGSLCISNYLVEVHKELRRVEQEKNLVFSEDYIVGTLCRSLRTYASFVRERDLQECLEDIMGRISSITKKPYRFIDVSAQVDSQEKTDILMEYDGKTYRIWSYQVTNSGISKTSGRILGYDGKRKLTVANNGGYNLLMPFDMDGKKDVVEGWYLYNRDEVCHVIINSILDDNNVITCNDIYDMLHQNRNAVKQNLIFMVG